tara:strand:+ start:5084 stop:5407 length:324 start_codon:yes stop_codon:yes gene_type:complete
LQKEDFFKKTIEEIQDTLRITISYEQRKSAFEPKRVFNENIEDFIPKHLSGKVKLVDSPHDKISNLVMSGHSPKGTWVYKIQKPNQQSKQSTKKRTSRARRASASKK